MTLSTSINWPVDALPKKWVEKLFDRMLFSYGKKFTEQWGSTNSEGLKIHWAKELHKLTGEQLRCGVEKLDTLDWPPTLPMFIKLCKPSIDSTVAYYEAINGLEERKKGGVGTWSHPAIFWATTKLSYDLLHQSFSQIKDRWEFALKTELEKTSWDAIPKPLLEIASPKLSVQEANDRINELKASEVFKTEKQPAFDHKNWAKNIMSRFDSGDKSLTSIQVQFAKEAISSK